MERWIAGAENPRTGMRTIINSNGNVIAFCLDDKYANRIARIPETAIVKFATGRYRLEVNGVTVAVEGDPIRDMRINGDKWNRDSLHVAADLINGELQDAAGLINGV